MFRTSGEVALAKFAVAAFYLLRKRSASKDRCARLGKYPFSKTGADKENGALGGHQANRSPSAGP